MRESFILYTSYQNHIELLTNEQRGILFTAILRYQAGTELPEMDGMTNMLFSVIKTDLDKNNEKYDKVCERNAQNIRKRWNTKNTSGTSGIEPNTKNTYNDNEYDNDNHNEDDSYDNDYGVKDKVIVKKEEKKTSKKFLAPTIDEVRAYAVERGREDLVERFYNYYSASEWKDKSGKKVKNWKLKFVTWENNNPNPQSTTFFAKPPQVDGSGYRLL